MKPDPHIVAANIESLIRNFLRDYNEAPRLLAEYCGLGSYDALVKAEEKSDQFDEIEEERNGLQTSMGELESQFQNFASGVRQITAACYAAPNDIDVCHTGTLIGRLEDLFEDEFPERIYQALPKLPIRKIGTAIGIDPDFPESFIPFLDVADHARKLQGELPPAPPTPEPQAEHSAPPQAAAPPHPTPPARAARSKKPKAEVPPATKAPEVKRNDARNGIELRFDGKPSDEVREALKSHGFRWLPSQPGQPWAALYTEERWVFAYGLAEQAEVLTGAVPSASIPEPRAEHSAPAPAQSPPPSKPYQIPDFL